MKNKIDLLEERITLLNNMLGELGTEDLNNKIAKPLLGKEKFNNLTGSYNVAVDAHNNFPIEFNTIISDIKRRLEDGK